MEGVATTAGERRLFEAVGFRWDRASVPAVPTRRPVSVERVVWQFLRALPEFVWDAAQLEGNPFAYPEVQTLLDGVTVGGHKVSDERQVLNLAASSRRLADLVTKGQFALTKAVSDELHAIIAQEEALEWGHFRGEGSVTGTPSVFLGEYGRHIPPATEPGGANLRAIHTAGLAAITDGIESVFERAAVYCLFACRNLFYFDANKRTSRAMMNGHLLAHGIHAISVPASRRLEYNTKMIDFYRLANATGMIEFFVSCLPGETGAGIDLTS